MSDLTGVSNSSELRFSVSRSLDLHDEEVLVLVVLDSLYAVPKSIGGSRNQISLKSAGMSYSMCMIEASKWTWAFQFAVAVQVD